MKKIKIKTRLLLTIAATALLGLAPGLFPTRAALLGLNSGSGGGGGTASVSYRGEAAVVIGGVAGIPLQVCDTGPLPSSGGAREASVLKTNVLGVLNVEVCHATTIGQAEVTASEASSGNVAISVGGQVIFADTLRAEALVSCCTTGPSLSGRSHLANLVINGQAITVSGQPNQTILLPNGRIVINEQLTLLTETTADITVNALRIVINGVADIAVCSAFAGITCGGGGGGGEPPPCDDFVTGGGWITGTPTGEKANFGVAGGIQDGAFWGHLNYIDHGSGMHVKHTAVIGYTVVDERTRLIDYTVTIDGQPGTARVRVTDNGEPGRDDIFEIALSNGYSAGGDLGGSRPGGGNIQLHKCQ